MNKKILYLTSKKFFHKDIAYGFFTRKGGVSPKPFNKLNCGKSTKDKIKNVKKNINLALKTLNLNDRTLVLGNQIHSNKTLIINNKFNQKKRYFVDGLISKNKNYALGIITADCAPIFFYDSINKIIGAAHAGWRGCLNNICNSTISSMVKLGCRKKNIESIIGPCIKSRNYEVDKNLYSLFRKKDVSYTKFFEKKSNNNYNFSLMDILHFQLSKLRIGNIVVINEDTYSNSLKYYSYRRSCHLQLHNTGRMVNIIGFIER